MQERDVNKEKNIIIIILIIIIIILLIYLIINHLGTIEVKVPTGNVDIYDIIVKEDDELDSEKQDEKDGGVIVYDENKQEINKAPLKIFEHKSYYTKNDVIAPGTENSYEFVIRNKNEFAIIYNLQIYEINEFNINMKFRLKQNGKYVLGNDEKWVNAEELKQSQVVLANESHNTYTLDWKWFESENDTQIGENIESYYKLAIKFSSNKY